MPLSSRDGDVAGRLQEAAEGLAGRGLQGGAKAAGAFVLKKWRKIKPAPAQAALPEFTELADAPAPEGQPSTPPPAAEDFGPAPLQGLLNLYTVNISISAHKILPLPAQVKVKKGIICKIY